MMQCPLNGIADLDAERGDSRNERSSLTFLDWAIYAHPVIFHDVGYRQLIERTEVKSLPEHSRLGSPVPDTADNNGVRPVHLQGIRSPGSNSYQPPDNSRSMEVDGSIRNALRTSKAAVNTRRQTHDLVIELFLGTAFSQVVAVVPVVAEQPVLRADMLINLSRHTLMTETKMNRDEDIFHFSLQAMLEPPDPLREILFRLSHTAPGIEASEYHSGSSFSSLERYLPTSSSIASETVFLGLNPVASNLSELIR